MFTLERLLRVWWMIVSTFEPPKAVWGVKLWKIGGDVLRCAAWCQNRQYTYEKRFVYAISPEFVLKSAKTMRKWMFQLKIAKNVPNWRNFIAIHAQHAQTGVDDQKRCEIGRILHFRVKNEVYCCILTQKWTLIRIRDKIQHTTWKCGTVWCQRSSAKLPRSSRAGPAILSDAHAKLPRSLKVPKMANRRTRRIGRRQFAEYVNRAKDMRPKRQLMRNCIEFTPNRSEHERIASIACVITRIRRFRAILNSLSWFLVGSGDFVWFWIIWIDF